MKVIGLDGRPHKMAGRTPSDNDDRPRSAGHLKARALLRRLWIWDPVWEEVLIPGGAQHLYLDFFLPRRNLAVEVQGIQHRKFVPYFHGRLAGWLEQLKRDELKVVFCRDNKLLLVCLNDDCVGEWESRLLGVFGGGN